jgi:Glycerophosphoryl diester phosphodiesterase family
MLLMACRDEPEPPRVEAYRGGAGYWPENSATAVAGVAREGLPGVYLDLSLTADGVPVLLRGPALAADRCTLASGQPLVDPPVVAELTLEALQSDFRCGGLPQPEHINAIVRAEPVLALAAAVEELQGSFDTVVRLGVDSVALADAAVAVWSDLDPPNYLALSIADPEVVHAAQSALRAAGLSGEVLWVGADPVSAQEAAADGLVVDAGQASEELLDEALAAELPVWAVAADGDADPWPAVAVLSTPYPGDLPRGDAAR